MDGVSGAIRTVRPPEFSVAACSWVCWRSVSRSRGGDQQGRVGAGRGARLVEGGDQARGHAPVVEEFGDRAAAVGVGRARVEHAVLGGRSGPRRWRRRPSGGAPARARHRVCGSISGGRWARPRWTGEQPRWSFGGSPADAVGRTASTAGSTGSAAGAAGQHGLAALQAVVEGGEPDVRAFGTPTVPPYVTSSKSRAAARSRSACAGSVRPASEAASSAVRPGRTSSRARSSRERTTARMRSWTAWFQWPWAACASAAARCSAALRGRSSKSMADDMGVRRGVPRRHHRAPRSARTTKTRTTRPSAPPGAAEEAASNSLSSHSQKASRARWTSWGRSRGTSAWTVRVRPPPARGRAVW